MFNFVISSATILFVILAFQNVNIVLNFRFKQPFDGWKFSKCGFWGKLSGSFNETDTWNCLNVFMSVLNVKVKIYK